MKYFALLLVIAVVGGAVYLRIQQPKLWNQYLEDLKATDASGKPGDQTASDSSAAGGDNDASNSEASTTPAPATPRDQPEIIAPTGTNYLNPSHTRPVEQPPQPGEASAPNTNAPATQAPPSPTETPAPAANPAPAAPTNSPPQ